MQRKLHSSQYLQNELLGVAFNLDRISQAGSVKASISYNTFSSTQFTDVFVLVNIKHQGIFLEKTKRRFSLFKYNSLHIYIYLIFKYIFILFYLSIEIYFIHAYITIRIRYYIIKSIICIKKIRAKINVWHY